MGESRVVRPKFRRVTISDGDWLLLKEQLTHGEQQEAFARKYVADVMGNRLNLRLVGMDRVLAFLVDWSLVGLDNQVIDIRGKSTDEVEGALNSLDTESVAEIRTAVEQHEADMEKERAERKNSQGIANASSVTSPSPFAVTGASSGFGN